ncbi:hypothetical protein [Rhizohabitans arisaemae]|uniref:hypothetical protein n=1 Tax=Rhizohabitans arisaemae TaxID=2720610 RepID=UPI0024B0609B|nr:hypothetical protein [Rhizohabitans arisaemae]
MPDSPHAGGPAVYRLFETDNAVGDSIVDLVIDQFTHRGSWVTHTVAVADATDLTVRLVDTGPGSHTVTVDAVSIAC